MSKISLIPAILKSCESGFRPAINLASFARVRHDWREETKRENIMESSVAQTKRYKDSIVEEIRKIREAHAGEIWRSCTCSGEYKFLYDRQLC